MILIESSEESGSPDLPYYVAREQTKIGTPSLVICLDSGGGSYDALWMVTSLRGLLHAELKVQVSYACYYSDGHQRST